MESKRLVPHKLAHDGRSSTIKLKCTKKPGADAPKASSVVKIAQLTDEATGEVYDRFQALTTLGNYAEVNVPRDKSESVGEVIKALRKYGAHLSRKHDEQIVQDAINSEPREYIRHTGKPGWYDDKQTVYVRNTNVIGSVPGVEIIRPPLARKGEPAQIAFSQAGSVADWIKEVAMPARWSSRLILALGIAFGAPLLRVIGYQSFGINLFGRPKSGKSTAQVVTGSVVGLGTEASLPSFNTTDNAPFQIANQCNDGPAPINEAALLGSNPYARLGPLTYALCEGKDKARLSGNRYATDVAHSGWSIIFLMSSERSIEELALQAGQSRQGGEIARCLDIPAIRGRNKTIFDRRPRGMSDEVFAKRSEQRLLDLRASCERNHGVVFDNYIRHLIAMGDDLKPQIEALVDFFVKRLSLEGADGATKHAAKNFGVLYAGLCLAIKAGILPPPWCNALVGRALEKCFLDGLKTTRLCDTTLADAKKLLHRKLKEVNLPARQKARRDTHLGWQTLDGNRTLFAIRSTEFVKWFDSKAQLRAILTWLDEAGTLKRADESERPTGSGYEWAVTTPRWSDAKVKCIVFSVPSSK